MRVNNRYQKEKPKRNMSIKKPIKHSHQENAKYTHLPKFATSYFPLCIFACEGAPMEHHKVTKANERKCEDTREAQRYEGKSAMVEGKARYYSRYFAVATSHYRLHNFVLWCVWSSLSFKDNFSYKMASAEEE